MKSIPNPNSAEDLLRFYLVSNRHLSAEQLAALIPTRSIGAIQAALGGIDQYLHGRDVAALLSQRCIAILAEEVPR